MANEVEIILKAVDRASGEINKVTTAGGKLSAGFKSLTGFSIGAAGGLAAAGIASQKLINFLQQSIAETEQYVTSITDMSRVLGMSTEETSRLVQASDDLFISQDKLKVAMLAASRQGIDVSIAGLKDLSTQCLNLNAGAERSQFVMKTFGRSGAEMGKLLEVGADGIDAATAAIADNLIVTAQSKTNIENYKRSVDNLSDSWQGMKYAIGNELIPQLDYLMRLFTKGVDPIEENYRAIEALEMQILRLGGAHGFSAGKVAELQAEIDALTSVTTAQTEAQKFLQSSVISTTTYFKALTQELLFNLAAEGLDADQALALAEGMGLVDSAAMAEITAVQLLRDEFADTGDLDTYIGKMGSLAGMLDYINKHSKIDIVINTGGTSTIPGVDYGAGYYNSTGQWVNTGATGGMGGGSTLVGERGPEIVDLPRGSRVYSNTESKQMGGGLSQSDMSAMAKLFAVAVATEMQKANG